MHSTGPSHRGSAGDMLVSDLATLLEETVLLLERLAEVHSTNKKKSIFLINNYDQVLCIFQERRVAGKEVNRFAELLMQQREVFVEEELLQGFSKMIAFVQQTESQFARSASGQEKKADVNQAVVEGLVREFATSWKQNIELINRNVLSYFSNFRNGMEILKQVLTQLLLYYTRFQDIIRKVYRGKPPSFSKDLVSTTVILAEIKKYALSI
jgi:urease gamma subunit